MAVINPAEPHPALKLPEKFLWRDALIFVALDKKRMDDETEELLLELFDDY